MKVIRARLLGFCMGVRRAVELAERASLEKGRFGALYTLGPLIHNASVLESLRKQGLICLQENELSSIPADSTVIIRAHGVSPIVERELLKKALHILDATCPRVKQSQSKARNFVENGCRLFIAGEENHGEIAGIKGYAEDGCPTGISPPEVPSAEVPSEQQACFVVGNAEEAAAAAGELYRSEPEAKTALIAQTTIRAEEYRTIGEKIRQFFPALQIVDSICKATVDRQNALRELGDVDAIIIAGSRESANTQRLLSLAREMGKPAWLTEAASDIPPEVAAYETVGLSAGASTPDDLIDAIEEALKNLI
jgi:4-hydroxy-3-methylbut-2-enyl diphosphate reductase